MSSGRQSANATKAKYTRASDPLRMSIARASPSANRSGGVVDASVVDERQGGSAFWFERCRGVVQQAGDLFGDEVGSEGGLDRSAVADVEREDPGVEVVAEPVREPCGRSGAA